MALQDPRPSHLWINDDCREKLAARDLTVEDAHWAFSRDPVWVRQKRQPETAGRGERHSRPGRWRLIGRSLSGEVISVVVELPDRDGRSQIVTAYPSPGRDQARYSEHQRRRRG